MGNGRNCSCCTFLSFPQFVCPSGCVQSWLVTLCGFGNVIQCPNATSPPPPPHQMTAAFRSIGAESNECTGSVSGWVGVCGRQVGCEGDCGKYREGSRVVVIDTFYTLLAQRYTVKHRALRASVGMPVAGTGVAEAGADAVLDEVAPLRRRVSVQWPG